ncbi:MAG TPA: Gfo/Idh/MocA family oxidoreductase [Thermoleophilaceae bacterium]
MAEPLRVALAGYGLAGSVFHAPLIAATDGLELRTVVTSNPERAEQVRTLHPGARVVERAEAVFEAADEHDLLVVATPNRSHVPLGLAALEAGLHVVVDKPLATSAADGRRLVEAARERDRLVSVFQNRRFDGDFLTARRLIESGELGDVLRFESRFERWRPEPKPGSWRERGEAEEGGGLLFDLGSHLIDQALVLFGPVANVYAEVDRRRPGVQADDDVFVALQHESGARSHLWASAVAAQLGPRLRVLGSRAAYVKWGLDPQEAQLSEGTRPGNPGYGRERDERFGTLGRDNDTRRIRTEPGAYERYYELLRDAIAEGSPPPSPAEDGVAVLELIEAARKNAQRADDRGPDPPPLERPTGMAAGST